MIRVMLLLAAYAAAQPQISVPLETAASRKPAPVFALKDARGKTVRLNKFRGKVVLVDFWATWCTGCKQEIPWFENFQRDYRKKGLAVVGISMDEDGWKVLNPFLAEHPIPYQIVLGGDSVAAQYRIETMPDTFLIDRHGRIAAAYRAGLVDRGNIERNIESMLAER